MNFEIILIAGVGYPTASILLAIGTYRDRPVTIGIGGLVYIVAMIAAISTQSVFGLQVATLFISLLALLAICIGAAELSRRHRGWPSTPDIVIRNSRGHIVVSTPKEKNL